MGSDYNTLELARIYENQGYLEDALAVYTALDEAARGHDLEVRAGCQRMAKALNTAPESAAPALAEDDSLAAAQARVRALVADWVQLIVMERRLSQLNQIRDRA